MKICSCGGHALDVSVKCGGDGGAGGGRRAY